MRFLGGRFGRGLAVAGVALGTTVSTLGSAAPPAHASLLRGTGGLIGGLVGTLGGVVGGAVGILTPGWDDNATTPPAMMSDVTMAIVANSVWSRGATGNGVGVALPDSGVAPVDGLTGPGKV